MTNEQETLIKPVIIGKIGSCYGIYGWLRVFSSTEKAENILKYLPWFILKSGRWQKIDLDGWRHHNCNLIVKFKNINNRDKANLLTNHEITVSSSQLPILENGSYYWKDLIGCRVINIKGYDFGKVINIIETGSNDVLIIRKNMKDKYCLNKKRLIPFIYRQVIKQVDLSIQKIEVDWDPLF